MPPPSTQSGPDHPAPSDTTPHTRGRGHEHGYDDEHAEPDERWVERSVERSPLEAAEDAFGWLVTGPAPLSLRGVDRPSLPRRMVPLHHLRTRLAAGRLRPRDRDAIWAALIFRARTSPSPAARARWTLGCVGVALPSLVPLAARLSVRYPGDPADLEAAILAAFLAELARIDICGYDLPARLCGSAERAAAALAVALYAHDHTTTHATDSDGCDGSDGTDRPGDGNNDDTDDDGGTGRHVTGSGADRAHATDHESVDRDGGERGATTAGAARPGPRDARHVRPTSAPGGRPGSSRSRVRRRLR